jgi:hypothetical protein
MTRKKDVHASQFHDEMCPIENAEKWLARKVIGSRGGYFSIATLDET